ncbi:pLS20_p028 family conjugation system transmembrane protein [Lactococcus garvieae]|uniref:pLS20_p028 family conjugation system transmembrane protein n=1 Tax=Lactococcus garvieae TaxID=1363 RepID=UPI002551711C|nr:hypothetical protein [Lactococcus garvieae]
MKKKIFWCLTLLLLFFPLFSMGSVKAADDFTPPSFGEDFTPPDTGGEFEPPSLNPDDPNYGGDLNGDLKKNLQNWQDDLSVSDPLTSIVRGIAWWLIIQTGDLVNSITGAFNNTYQILDLYGSEEKPGPIQKVIDSYMPIFIGIGIAVFVSLTMGILFSKNQDVVIILKNLLLGISIFVLLPFGFGQISSLTTDIAKNISTSSNSGYDVVDQNITDLYALDKNYDWVVPKNESITDKKIKRNYIKGEEEQGKITKQVLENININETADPGKMGKVGKKIASNMLVTNEKGQLTTVSLNDGVGKSWWMSLITGDAQYYRYHVNFFTLIFYIVLVLIITGFLLYKLIKILIELVMNASILQATSTMDTKGKRNWEIISKIVSGFGAVVMVVFLQVFFSKGYEVTSTLGGGPVVQAVAAIALAFSVIEGPNIFQSTFGVHVGLDSGLKDLMTLSQTSMLLQNGGNAAKNLSQGAMNTGAGIAGTTAGIMSGMFGGNNENGSSDNLSKSLDNDSNEDGSDNDINSDNNINDDVDMNNQNNDKLDNQNNVDEKNIAEDAGDSDEENMAGVSDLNETSAELESLAANEPPADDISSGIEQDMPSNTTNDPLHSQEPSSLEADTPSSFGGEHSEEGNTSENSFGSKAPDEMAQEPDLGDVGKESPNLGQMDAGESQARAQGLGSTIRNLAGQSLSNKVNSPNRNMFNSFTSTYNTSQSLTKGTKNSIRSLSQSPIEE